MDEAYNRGTWRQGKKHPRRPRLNHWAGKTKAPEAFLLAAESTNFRHTFKLLPKCKRCNRLALKGMNVCGIHGGKIALAKRGQHVPKISQEQRKERRKAWLVQESVKCPPELQRMPIYLASSQEVRVKLVLAWQTPAWPRIISEVKRSQSTV